MFSKFFILNICYFLTLSNFDPGGISKKDQKTTKNEQKTNKKRSKNDANRKFEVLLNFF